MGERLDLKETCDTPLDWPQLHRQMARCKQTPEQCANDGGRRAPRKKTKDLTNLTMASKALVTLASTQEAPADTAAAPNKPRSSSDSSEHLAYNNYPSSSKEQEREGDNDGDNEEDHPQWEFHVQDRAYGLCQIVVKNDASARLTLNKSNELKIAGDKSIPVTYLQPIVDKDGVSFTSWEKNISGTSCVLMRAQACPSVPKNNHAFCRLFSYVLTC